MTKVTAVQNGTAYWFIECEICGTVDEAPIMYAVLRCNDHRDIHDKAQL